MWPMPTGSDWKGAGPTNIRQDGKDRKKDRLDYATYSPESGGQLNPDWVEWLMNWPTGWSSPEPLTKELFDDWMQKASADWWKEEPHTPRVAKGVKDRVSRLKAIGNGQVPLAMAYAYEILSRGITK